MIDEEQFDNLWLAGVDPATAYAASENLEQPKHLIQSEESEQSEEPEQTDYLGCLWLIGAGLLLIIYVLI